MIADAIGFVEASDEQADAAVSRLASAIGEPARTRMLYSLVDGRARTSTELAMAAGVTPSTASVHLNRLLEEGLVVVHPQGKHRYYRLSGQRVARVLEGLAVLAGGSPGLKIGTPPRLRAARTCYDHIAGALGVALHDRFCALKWLAAPARGDHAYGVTEEGAGGFVKLGLDLETAQSQRRRFAYGCVDWSERRPHLGGALGAALLHLALKRKWVTQSLDSRALEITAQGRRELGARLGLSLA